MHILMLFLDGIGLGDDDPEVNPFAVAQMPTLTKLTNGRRWLRGIGRQVSERASFVPTDPCLNVSGRPQSATGQATILTGRNIPQIIGEHYGPKPSAPIRELLAQNNFFKQVKEFGKQAALIEGYPSRWHKGIDSGMRLRASYQQAAYEAGQTIFGEEKVNQGEALTAEWTGEAWHTHLKLTATPIYTPVEAGRQMVKISQAYDFAFHAHWMTDLVGHRGPLDEGVKLLETFDGVMSGVLDSWDDDEGLVIITSDHGNMEEIGNRKHTRNNVPTLIIGKRKDEFADGLADLTGFVPRMARLLLQ